MSGRLIVYDAGDVAAGHSGEPLFVEPDFPCALYQLSRPCSVEAPSESQRPQAE